MNRLQQLIALLAAMSLPQLRAQRATVVQEADAAGDAAIAAANASGRATLNEAELAAQNEFNAMVAAIDQRINLQVAKIERAAGAPPVLDTTPPGAPVIQVGAANIAKDPMWGFKSVGEFAQQVKQAQDISSGKFNGKVDERLMAAPTGYHQSSGEGAEIPPAVRAGIWELVWADPLLALLNVEPTDSPVVQMFSDETTPWGASGIVANWRQEAGQMTAAKLVTKTKDVRLHELYAFALVPEELLADAPRLSDRLNRKMPAAIGWKLVESFLTGTGAGQPLGWMNTNNAGKLAVTRSGANLIAVADVLGMWKRILQTGGPDRTFWATNRDTVSQLMTMSVANQPVWLPPNGLQAAPGGTLLGRPVYYTDHAEALGTAGDIQLVNPDGYLALSRGAAKSDVSIHLYFDYAITAFRMMVRFGGQPILNAAVSAAKGPSRSHFVHLTT